MFLSKKNAVYFNKPKNIEPKPKRILAGWEDDEQEKTQTYQSHIQTDPRPTQSNLLSGEEFVDLTGERGEKGDKRQKFYLTWDDLDAMEGIQCEKRVVEEIVQPGGIRIKPNDNMLNELLREIKGMEVHVIGSLLMSKLEVNYGFQIKAKALYTIEFLAKKNDKYLTYFKAHVNHLSGFPEPQDNVENYRKILKVVLNFIGISSANEQQQEQEQRPVFVDPGYNDDPRSKISNFIQQNGNKTKKSEQKKIVIGPGQTKAKVEQQKKVSGNEDFLSLDLLGGVGFSQQGNSNPLPAQNNNFNLLF